jgi:hypothetical protein
MALAELLCVDAEYGGQRRQWKLEYQPETLCIYRRFFYEEDGDNSELLPISFLLWMRYLQILPT